MSEWMNKKINKRTKGYMDRQTDGQVHGRNIIKRKGLFII